MQRPTRRAAIVLLLTAIVGLVSAFVSRRTIRQSVLTELTEGLVGTTAAAKIAWLNDREVTPKPFRAESREEQVRNGLVGKLIPARANEEIAIAMPSSGYSGWAFCRVRAVAPFVTVSDYDGQSWFGSARSGYGRFSHGREVHLAFFGFTCHIGGWGTGGTWHRRVASALPNAD
jgi:hypothetical protein